MNIKSLIKYQFRDYKIMLFVYNTIRLIMLLLFSILSYFIRPISIKSAEMSTLICIFSIIVSYTSMHLRVFIQNGFSRKTAFFSLLSSTLLLSIICAFCDVLLNRFSALFLDYESIFNMVYANWYVGTFQEISSEFFWFFSLYSLLGCIGILVNLITLSLEKIKIALLWVGIPLLIAFVAILDIALLSGHIIQAFLNGSKFIFGFYQNNINPFLSVACLFGSVLILSFPIYLCTRKFQAV